MGRRFAGNKLLWKGTSFIVISFLIGLGTFTVFFSNYLSSRLQKKTRDYGVFLLGAIEQGFFQSMIHQDRQFIVRLFEDLCRHEDITLVAIYDCDGKLALSSKPGSGFSLNAMRLLDKSAGEYLVNREANGGHESLILAHPILNQKRCQSCHGADKTLLGTLGIEFSLKNIDAFTSTTRLILLLNVAGLAVMLMAVNLGFFSRFIVAPLEKLNLKIREVEKGNAGVRFSTESGDEISELEKSFGTMVGKLQNHYQLEVEKEKEMVLMVQDLKHQMELSAVTNQLASRAQEVDLANRKINRLATRLEEKNEHLAKMIKRITALNRLGVALSAELEMEKLIRLVVNVSVKGLRAERGFLMMMEEGTRLMRMAYGMGLGEEFDQTIPVEIGDSISGVVAEKGKPLLIEDMGKDGRFRRVSRYGFLRKSIICAPLRVKDRVLGTVELTNKKGEEYFSADDLDMLTSMCAQAAIAIDNAKLYQKIQKSYFDTVRALIQAVEEKDRYTRGHSERVTLFSLKISEMMGLDQKRLDVLKYAGYLHDIGKIGIDINILQKKGKLNAEEYGLVKNHPLIGERIIAPIEFLKDVRGCISQHHERYDGFGYPRGIRGKEMSLEARILAVADAYDAMITDRPYRRAFPKESALAELRRCSGTQFDPEVVEVFIEVLETDQEVQELQKNLSTVGT